MDIEVDEKIYMPKFSDSLASNLFGETNISFIMLLIFVVGVYIIVFYVLGNLNTDNVGSSYIVLVIEIIMWIILIYVVYININKYNDNNVDFQMKIENLFNTKISELIVNSETNKPDDKDSDTRECDDSVDGNKEVFHIASNEFSYEEARDICEKYNARLANYEEIENSYINGANWCSYGWSKDQLGLFPIQKSLYNELKQIPGHEYDCGRPGINGGYFENKELKFGANCYGVKPKARKQDEDYTHALNHTPELNEDEIKDQNFKNKYIVAPFNKDTWTETE
tara:strand:- start:315 stop:1160 length:846 start_codon:yes stop_codon:yes gene_type:complete